MIRRMSDDLKPLPPDDVHSFGEMGALSLPHTQLQCSSFCLNKQTKDIPFVFIPSFIFPLSRPSALKINFKNFYLKKDVRALSCLFFSLHSLSPSQPPICSKHSLNSLIVFLAFTKFPLIFSLHSLYFLSLFLAFTKLPERVACIH